jgi:uncharacterized protein (TIGR00725 family)
MPVQIAVIGPSQPTNEQIATAQRVGELLAQRGAIVICGDEEGVMEAVSAGASRAGGT